MKKILLATIALFMALSNAAHTHSGGVNDDGCHGGSKPYHCHNSGGGGKAKSTGGGGGGGTVYLYIYTRADGTPSYIGISNNPQRRFNEHERDGRAFSHHSRRIVGAYNSRAAAKAAERRLILATGCAALYNKAHC